MKYWFVPVIGIALGRATFGCSNDNVGPSGKQSFSEVELNDGNTIEEKGPPCAKPGREARLYPVVLVNRTTVACGSGCLGTCDDTWDGRSANAWDLALETNVTRATCSAKGCTVRIDYSRGTPDLYVTNPTEGIVNVEATIVVEGEMNRTVSTSVVFASSCTHYGEDAGADAKVLADAEAGVDAGADTGADADAGVDLDADTDAEAGL